MTDKIVEIQDLPQDAEATETTTSTESAAATEMECLYELLKCLEVSMCKLHDAFSVKVEALRAENELIGRQTLKPETRSEFAARRAMLRVQKTASSTSGPIWFEHEGQRFLSFVH